MTTLTAPEPARAPVDTRPPGNYLDLYGLTKPPFGGPVEGSSYILFPPHRRPFEMLVDHMLNGSGVVLLIGEEGIGKTETLRSAAAMATESGLKTIVVPRPPDGRISLPQLVSSLEGQPETFHQPPRKALLVEDIDLMPADCISFLITLARAKGDEGLGYPIVLTSSGTEASRPDVAELVGLARNTIRLLRLGAAEVRQYIERSLWIAGGTTRRLITPDAMKLITTRCGGVPGTVNRTMEAVLTAGFARGDAMITAKTVDSVIGPPAPRPRPRPVPTEQSWITGNGLPIAAIGLLVAGTSLFLYRGLTELPSPMPTSAAIQTAATQATGESGQAAKPATSLPPELMAVLMKRGNESLELGDIAAARLLFLRAAEGGNPAAATALGKTYDPNFASAPGARDPARAAEWYRRGIALGDAGAADLLRRIMPR